MTPEEIKKLVEDTIQALLVPVIQSNTHDGVTSPLVSGENIQHAIVAAAPTDNAPNGTIRLYFTGSTYRLYIRANNTWKFKTFDNT